MLGHRKPISLPDASSQLAFPALDSLGAGNQLACLTFGWDWKSDEPQSDRELARKWVSECASKQLHINQPIFGIGTINGGTAGNINGFVARSSKREEVLDLQDLNNEIDNFFQSPSERQSSNLFSRKSEIEQDISNETDNEKGEVGHELQDNGEPTNSGRSSSIFHEEAIDDQEEVKEATNDVKTNKTGPLRLSEANRREIDTAYNLMDKQYMWKLSSGKFVEEELYKLGKGLEFEHAVHSFILDVEDELIMEHFTETELREIDNTSIPEVPELSNEIDEFLNKFLGKTNLNEIQTP
ncbi:unnamed protein product [Rhizophagus irregularis]|nr:unnamed protein product [Rhizophagus irregularis]